MHPHPQTTHDDPLVPALDPYQRCADAAAQRAGIYTPPVIARAAQLLDALETTSTDHGISPDTWAYVTDLAAICIDAVASTVRAALHVGADAASDLLDRVVSQARTAGGEVVRYGFAVTCTVPPPRHRHPLCVSLTAADGWTLMFDTPHAGVVSVYAPYDEVGAQHVGTILADLTAGRMPLPRTLGR